MRHQKSALRLAVMAAVTIAVMPAYAAERSENGVEEITVTARKREETSIAVPVVLVALGAKDLQSRQITSVDGIARAVPQLLTGESGGSAQGGSMTMRGIGGNDGNPLADQALAFNIDDVAINFTSPRRIGEMDMAAIEVLKGPQSLYYGKDSPAGIITMRSADPTKEFGAKISGGYDFKGHEWRTEGYISGPITDKLGARLAFYASDMGGWLHNTVASLAGTSQFIDPRKDLPKQNEWAVRGTLKYDANDRVHMRLKVSYDQLKSSGNTYNTQLIYCPYGTPQNGSALDDCKANDKFTRGLLGPNFGLRDPVFGDGSTYFHSNQLLSSLNVDIDLTDSLKLSSVTGLYKAKNRSRDSFDVTYVPTTLLVSTPDFDARNISQELRLTSSFQGPINFTVGGYYQSSRMDAFSDTWLNGTNPSNLNNYYYLQNGNTYSAFGELFWKIIPTVELSGGARYTSEDKQLPVIATSVAPSPRLPVTVNPTFTHGKWHNVSPEATINWRPTQDLTIFASYRKGYLSGGFNAGSSATAFTSDQRYNQEDIHGFEGGVKASLFDNTLRTNFDVYYYKLTGLQVVTFPVPGQPGITTNAGVVSIRGAEFDATYKTPVEGLSVNGAIDYNDGTYDNYTAACYNGQTQALGCNFGTPRITNGVATYSSQNLNNTRLTRSPVWTGNFGAQYETPVSTSYKVGFSGNVMFSSMYITDPTDAPGAFMPRFALLDAGMHVGRADDRWELALIGRNLTNRIYYVRTSQQSFTGSAGGGLTGRLSDISANVNRGREIWLRLTVKTGE